MTRASAGLETLRDASLNLQYLARDRGLDHKTNLLLILSPDDDGATTMSGVDVDRICDPALL
jgi:hypothetical protein